MSSQKRLEPTQMIHTMNQTLNKMNRFINAERFAPHKREMIQTQIVWLKHQMRYWENRHDSSPLIYRYNWVIDNINNVLELPKEEQFPHFEQAA